MTVKDVELKKWGNSKGLIIGKEEMTALGLSEGHLGLTMVVEDGKIILTAREKYPQTLEELFDSYNGTSLDDEDRYKWDSPVGRELL